VSLFDDYGFEREAKRAAGLDRGYLHTVRYRGIAGRANGTYRRLLEQPVGAFSHRNPAGLAIPGDIETNLDLALDAITASDRRIIGDYRMKRSSIAVGPAWQQLLIIFCMGHRRSRGSEYGQDEYVC